MEVHIAVEKDGIPRAIDVAPANVHDTKGIVPVLREIAGRGFQGPAIGDLGYRGQRLAKAGGRLASPFSRSPEGAAACSFPPKLPGSWSARLDG